jgi:RNA polymerase-associated protein CTR9
MYEESLQSLTLSAELQMEEVSTSILYNLARAYEAQNEHELATEAYAKLLSRHPEYIDGKAPSDLLRPAHAICTARIRQAQMLKDAGQINEAGEILAQALNSHSNNLNLRAFYTYFLCQANQIKLAKDFVITTLKEHDKHDIYSLCAAGYVLYQQARETRDLSPDGIKGRRRNFERAVEFYEKALILDPTCAIAAQGLAIASAEDALGTLSGITTADDSQRRSLNIREALDVFAKVRETVSDGSVYANMGHCYYAREEFERALECVSSPSLLSDSGN